MPCVRYFVGFLPQSRKWLRRHVKQSVQKFPMHATSLAGVPRMRLCSSLFVVAHSGYNSGVNGECATNEFVQFFVCCGTCVLSVGLLFVNAELFFLKPCLFQRLVGNYSFLFLL